MNIKLLVADDYQIVRYGVRELLVGTSIEVVGEAATCRETLELAEHLRPDVLLLDVRLPEARGRRIKTDGLDLLKQLTDTMPELKVVMFSNYENPIYVARSVALGAADFIFKTAGRDVLTEVIRSAASEQSPSLNGEMRRIADLLKLRRTFNDNMVLTKRETQVLRHVALGLSNYEISRVLGVSTNTIREHVQNIMRKVEVHDRSMAAAWAMRNHIV